MYKVERLVRVSLANFEVCRELVSQGQLRCGKMIALREDAILLVYMKKRQGCTAPMACGRCISMGDPSCNERNQYCEFVFLTVSFCYLVWRRKLVAKPPRAPREDIAVQLKHALFHVQIDV